MNRGGGYTLSRLEEKLSDLKGKFPFLDVGCLGKSFAGREISLVGIGEGKKSVLLVGAHHGMEWITTGLLLRYAEEYCRAVSEKRKISGVDADRIYETRRVFLVPMLNPDGVELQINGADPQNPLVETLSETCGGDFSHWQANGRGVDLNHNYNAGFEEYKSKEPALGIFGGGPTRFSGEFPESEPETAALCAFIRREEPRLLLALHTQGEEIYADYNGYIPPRGGALAARMAALSGYRVARPEEAACYGGLKDWFVSEFRRPGFTLECGKGVNPLPVSQEAAVYASIRGILLSFPTFI